MADTPSSKFSFAPNPEVGGPVPTEATVMDQLADCMDGAAWQIFMSLMNWAMLMEEMYQGQATELNDDRYFAMMSAFVGFGGNPVAWAGYAPAVVPLLMDQLDQWTADDIYRKANTLPWCFLKAGAPALARASVNYEAGIKCRKIIAANFTTGETPDVFPRLSESGSPIPRESRYQQPAGAPAVNAGPAISAASTAVRPTPSNHPAANAPAGVGNISGRPKR